MTGRSGLVVVADDDAGMRLLCRVNLEHEGFRVAEATTSDQVERLVATEEVAVVLLDVHLGSENGVAIAHRLRERYPGVSVVFVSGSERTDERSRVSDAAIAKPFRLEELFQTVRELANGPARPRSASP
jgi:DNA-binding response OmpR family regulator